MNLNPFRALTTFQRMSERSKGEMAERKRHERAHPGPLSVKMSLSEEGQIYSECALYFAAHSVPPPLLEGVFGRVVLTPSDGYIPVGNALIATRKETVDGSE